MPDILTYRNLPFSQLHLILSKSYNIQKSKISYIAKVVFFC